MKYSLLAPSQINTIINLPASKSISNRTLIINALASEKAPIQNLSDCDDTQVMIQALSQDKPTIDILAAGTAMFPYGLLVYRRAPRTLTGTTRMQSGP